MRQPQPPSSELGCAFELPELPELPALAELPPLPTVAPLPPWPVPPPPGVPCSKAPMSIAPDRVRGCAEPMASST
jgi:hypothetical protein